MSSFPSISLSLSMTPTIDVSAPIAAIGRLLDSLSDMQVGPMAQSNLDASDIYQQQDVRDRFDVYSLGGGDWAILRPRTIRQKRNSYGANLILVENGNMRRSLDRGDPNHFIQPTSDGLREGSMDEKIGYHQSGTSRMPQRKVYPDPSPSVVDQMANTAAVGLTEAAREASFEAA